MAQRANFCFGVFLSSLEAVQCCFPLPFSSSFSPFHPNSYNLCFCVHFRWEKKWKKFFSLSIKQTQDAAIAILRQLPFLSKLPSISYSFFSVEAIRLSLSFFFFYYYYYFGGGGVYDVLLIRAKTTLVVVALYQFSSHSGSGRNGLLCVGDDNAYPPHSSAALHLYQSVLYLLAHK